jgi:CheY-like chemotaxis protein
MSKFESVHVLIVDDDQVDVLTMIRALSKVIPTTRVTAAHSGAEGLALLRSGAIARPYIVLVDIRMPEMSGHEFVSELRHDPTLKDSIVFFVTTSSAKDDIRRAYEQCVAGYVVKNADGADFSSVVAMLQQYTNVVELPA